MTDYADYKMWDQIIYQYQNFDDATFEVWTWVEVISSLTVLAIGYPC